MGHLSVCGARLDAGARPLLKDLTLEAVPGELLAVVGPNGVGKTTVLRALAGFITPAAGSVELDGAAVASLPQRTRACALSLIGGETETPHGMSVGQVVATGRFAHRAWWDWARDESDERAADDALARVGLLDFAERPFETLSSGERQRAWIALALAQEARVLLLDEPTSHLDVRYALEILALLRALADGGCTVVAVLHDLNEAARVADRVALLGDGRMLACAAPGVALDPVLLERAYGVAFERFEQDGAVRVLPYAESPVSGARA